MVQQNTTTTKRSSQGVLSFWWTIKYYPQAKSLKPYGAYHSKPFKFTTDAP